MEESAAEPAGPFTTRAQAMPATRCAKTATIFLTGLHVAAVFIHSARRSEGNALAHPAPQQPLPFRPAG